MSLRIFSRRVVLETETCAGEIVVEDRRIAGFHARESASPGALDWGEDLVVPGLVDIHTDNLEKHYMPRPGAVWDATGAALAHDAQCAAAGVTTVFDSLGFWGRETLERRNALADMIGAVDRAVAEGLLRADHLLHLRCQAVAPELPAMMAPHLDNPRLKLLSIMDRRHEHAMLRTRIAALRAAGGAEAEIAPLERQRLAVEEGTDLATADDHRRVVAGTAARLRLPLAAHDDCAAADVDEGVAEGARIAEFPMTLEAALRSREHGMVVVMGAPNFVRGGSHAGNLSARETAAAGLLDALCSDYVPLSMVRAAAMLAEPPFAWPLHRAFATVTRTPARCVGLTDRGALAPGLRADLVRVSHGPGRWPAPRETWVEGRRVA